MRGADSRRPDSTRPDLRRPDLRRPAGRSVLALALALALGCTFGGIAPGAAETAPYIAIRDLERLQDRIAAGDSLAAAAHAKAIAQTAVAFAGAKPAVWADERNARALALYLFSGGNAAVIAKAIPRDAVAKSTQTLYDGALAYGLGDDDKAREGLLPIEARSLPSNLGGHLALVQATLLAGNDKARAVERLDLARLLEPGTLVEEAALRKELMLLDVGGDDLPKFTLLSRRYAGSFPRSVYFANFRQLLGQAAMAAGSNDSPAFGARLEQIVEVLDTQDRCHLFLSVAREALLTGRFNMAAFASEKAQSLARRSETDQARAMVYFGAATIAGPSYEAGRKSLNAAAVARLGANDQALRQSALAVADMIRSPDFAAKPAFGNGDASVVTDGERALGTADEAMKLVEK